VVCFVSAGDSVPQVGVAWPVVQEDQNRLLQVRYYALSTYKQSVPCTSLDIYHVCNKFN
jgi:hypothetical protein